MNNNFGFRLADFYEKSVPYMCRQIESVPQIQKEKMVYNLNLARKFLLQIYNALLHSTSIKLLLTQRFLKKFPRSVMFVLHLISSV